MNYHKSSDAGLFGLVPEQIDNVIPSYDENEDMGWWDPSTSYFPEGDGRAWDGSSGGSFYYSTSSPPGYYTSPEECYPYSPTSTVDPNMIHHDYDYETYGSSMNSTPRTQPVPLR